MGFVKCVSCKAHHFIKYKITHLCRNSILNTARNSLFFIAIYEILSFLFHDFKLFLSHGSTNQVTASQGITSQVTYNLHNLFLIHNNAIGWLKNRFKLRTVVLDVILVLLSLHILWYIIHRSWSVQGNSCNNVI